MRLLGPGLTLSQIWERACPGVLLSRGWSGEAGPGESCSSFRNPQSEIRNQEGALSEPAINLIRNHGCSQGKARGGRKGQRGSRAGPKSSPAGAGSHQPNSGRSGSCDRSVLDVTGYRLLATGYWLLPFTMYAPSFHHPETTPHRQGWRCPRQACNRSAGRERRAGAFGRGRCRQLGGRGT